MNKTPFIVKIDRQKKEIEKQVSSQLKTLYSSIASTIYNLLKTNRINELDNVFKSHASEYVDIVRQAYRLVNAKMGNNLRTRLSFKQRFEFDFKAEQLVDVDTQEEINNAFEKGLFFYLTTHVLNIINTQFLDSEKNYFISLYEKSTLKITTDIKELESKLNDITYNIQNKEALLTQNKRIQKELAILNKQREVIKKDIDRITKERLDLINKQYIKELNERIDSRIESNSTYFTGEATKDIRNLEYQSITNNNGVINNQKKTPLKQAFYKVWRELSQFLPKSAPRSNHLSLSGTQPAVDGFWIVAGIPTTQPRDSNLPLKEVINCRCEIEYIDNF